MKLNVPVTAAAVVYFLGCLPLIFAPDETFAAIGAGSSIGGAWIAQLFGACLCALASLNWMGRYGKTEGILGRPVLLPNMLFASTGFLLTLGVWRRHPEQRLLLIAAAVLGMFSVAFGMRFFGKAAPATS